MTVAVENPELEDKDAAEWNAQLRQHIGFRWTFYESVDEESHYYALDDAGNMMTRKDFVKLVQRMWNFFNSRPENYAEKYNEEREY